MKAAIIASTRDIASVVIAKALLASAGLAYQGAGVYDIRGTPLHILDEPIVRLERIDEKIEADLFLFVSRHASKTEGKMLTVHSLGNFATAELGGEPGKLVPSSAKAMLLGMEAQSRAPSIGYDFYQEATHHGPYLSKPTLFFEMGTTEVVWQDPIAGAMVAESVLSVISSIDAPRSYTTAIGIGGLHHAIAFRSLTMERKIAIAHICPKYMLEHLDEAMLSQMIEKTVEAVKLIVLDWKGLGEHKRRILDMLSSPAFSSYEVMRKK